MRIGIVGTGKMGSGLARRLMQGGQRLAIASREPDKAAALAVSLGNGAIPCSLKEVPALADIVVLAVPYGAMAATLAALGDLRRKILVDISNPVTPDYMALLIGHDTSAAEEIQKLAPGARVVKAFNTVFADLFDVPAQAAPVQVFYTADDSETGARVAALITQAGFEPVHAGPLANARYLEPLGELNIHFAYALGWGTRLAPAWQRVA